MNPSKTAARSAFPLRSSSPDGEVWAGATGISHEGVPLTTDMLFRYRERAEKNLQAALALKLVEEGVLSLDDPLEKWLPLSPISTAQSRSGSC